MRFRRPLFPITIGTRVDRMLVAQAQLEGRRPMTADPQVAWYDLEIIST